MKIDILTFVAKCHTCESNKVEIVKTHEPLPILAIIWTNISMKFIVGLSKVGKKLVIIVVVERFSKYAHFFHLPHPFMPFAMAQVFMD
jgi:hypothetical protein